MHRYTLETQGDFDADGAMDLVWADNISGWRRIYSPKLGKSFDYGIHGETSRTMSAGDFRGDGSAGDVVWHDPATGKVEIWLRTNTFGEGYFSYNEQASLPNRGKGWKVAAVVDVDQDQVSDILWQNSQSGETEIWTMDAPKSISRSKMTLTVKGTQKAGTVSQDWAAQALDYNADGRTDILWHNNATGQNKLWAVADKGFTEQDLVQTGKATVILGVLPA